MKWLTVLLMLFYGCTITTEIKLDEETDKAVKKLASKLDEPIQVEQRYVPHAQAFSEERQDNLLKMLLRHNPRITRTDLITDFEDTAHVTYDVVITRNEGEYEIGTHPYIVGDLDRDGLVTRTRDYALWDKLRTEAWLKLQTEEKDEDYLKDLKEN